MEGSLLWFGVVVSFIFGSVIGSFLNVCIYRIPNKMSIAFPPSHCFTCNNPLAARDLIPVFSWLWLRGRCRSCGAKISGQYPLVETLTALLFVWGFLQGGLAWETLQYWVFAGLVVVISFIDFEHKIIPNVISLPGIVIGYILACLVYGGFTLAPLWGIFLGYGIIALIIILSRGGMGWGDAKLLAMIGAFYGMRLSFFSLMIGAFVGCIVGIVLMAGKKATRKTAIPFGPYLALGALISLELLRLFPDLEMFFPW